MSQPSFRLTIQADRRAPEVSLGYAAALLTTLIWGSSFVGTRLLLGEVAPLSVQALRFLFGTLAYLALLAVASRGWPKRPRRAAPRLALVAVFGPALNSLGVTLAIPYLGAGTSSLVIMLVPVLTGLLAALAGQERFSGRQLQGFAVALAGLAVVVLLGSPERTLAGGELIGLLFLFAGALGFAVYNVYSKPLFAFYSPLELSCFLGLLAPLSLLPFFASGPFWADLAAVGQLSLRGWLVAAYLGLASSVGAYWCWYYALRRLGATRTSLFSYLIPVWGLTLSALVLGERITAWLPLGVALVVAGIALANRRPAPRT